MAIPDSQGWIDFHTRGTMPPIWVPSAAMQSTGCTRANEIDFVFRQDPSYRHPDESFVGSLEPGSLILMDRAFWDLRPWFATN